MFDALDKYISSLKAPIYVVIGVPGSGKTWVCNQLRDKFKVVAHDDYMNGNYVDALKKAAKTSDKPILAEAPFSIKNTMEPLEDDGYKVIPVFILEDEITTTRRYEARDKKPIPKQHLTRLNTYRERAKDMAAFSGTSQEVLEYLQNVSH